MLKLSDPEIITLSICGELAGIDSESAIVFSRTGQQIFYD